VIWLPFALLACAPSEYGSGPEVWSDFAEHHDDGWLFEHGRINLIELEIDEDAERILRSERTFTDPRNEVPATASIDGEEVGVISVRLRGGLGSFRRYDEKPKWELDFNAYSGERFHGLEALSLNNAVGDCSMIREVLAHSAFLEAGVPASRSGYAQLFVNGKDYGLYVVLETQDDRWLERLEDLGWASDGDGNLYDGSYTQTSWWPVMVDFGMGRDALFDLEEGVDIGWADVTNISEALLMSEERGAMVTALELAVDWDELQRFWATEQWVGNTDSYSGGANNYKVYFQPGGAMLMNGWDTDAGFRTRGPGDPAWQEGGGRLMQACRDDGDCHERRRERAQALADELGLVDWVDRAEALVALTQLGADEDPRGQCAAATRAEEREHVLDWLDTASEELRAGWD
jgi:spore coat protein CotH